VDILFFLLAYLVYMVISLILLLNLLIAMMSTTYESIMERSVLEWRVDFARMVLKIELECEWLTKPPGWTCGLVKPWDLHAGEKAPNGRYLYYFKNVGRNFEGVEMEGGTEIFGDGLDSFEPDHVKPLPSRAATILHSDLDKDGRSGSAAAARTDQDRRLSIVNHASSPPPPATGVSADSTSRRGRVSPSLGSPDDAVQDLGAPERGGEHENSPSTREPS